MSNSNNGRHFVPRSSLETLLDDLLPSRESVTTAHWEIMAGSSNRKLQRLRKQGEGYRVVVANEAS